MSGATRIAVMGAGAVGSYFGGLLARAGHPVSLVARAAHVQAIAHRGLHLQTTSFDEFVPLQASTDPRVVAGADLVLFCVKSPDTEAGGAQIRPYLAPHTLVLCLQNGVDNAERLRAVLGAQPVAAAVVYVATEMAGPGHVLHHGRGDLVLEPLAADWVAPLQSAGIGVQLSENVRGALWLKLVINCAYNAVSAITQLPYGKTVTGAGVPGLMRDVVQECLAVAHAEGVQIEGDVDAAVRMIAERMPAQYASTAQDLARQRRSEIDYLNGLVVRRGEALGVATPVNRALWALVKLLESKFPA